MMKSDQIQVQGTNDSSIVSKLSMVEKGYFHDPFIRHFVKKPASRSPLINRCYHARAFAVAHCLEKFLRDGFSQQKQIISLGGGFDTSYFRMKEKGLADNLLYIEIDFPEVMKRKVALAKSADLLPSADDELQSNEDCPGHVVYRSSGYACIGFDLRKADKNLSNLLASVGVQFDVPTLLLSEVVLAYLTSAKSSLVLRWASFTFSNALTLIFEQICPNDSFGTVMCRHFKQIGGPLLSIRDFPTISSQVERHKRFGYASSSAISLLNFYYECIEERERKRIENLQIFDEFEAWHRACQHYFILCSTNSQIQSIKEFCQTLFAASDSVASKPSTTRLLATIAERKMQSFGQSSCVFTTKEGRKLVFTYGGFGISSDPSQLSMHQRLPRNLQIFDPDSAELTACNPHKNSSAALSNFPMFSSCVSTFDIFKNPVILLFGGRDSPVKTTDQLKIITPNQAEDATWMYKSRTIQSDQGLVWPAPRWRHSAAIINSIMIVFGGRSQTAVFDDCWAFDLRNEVWKKVELCGHPISARHSHSMCIDSSSDLSLILSGGLNGEQVPQRDVFQIAFENCSCLKANVTRLRLAEDFPLRYSHTSHVLENHLILVGGVSFSSFSICGDDNSSDRIDVIDLENFSWIHSLIIADDVSDLPIMLHNHSSVLIGRKLVVLGGGDNCFSFGTWFNHSPITIELDNVIYNT